MKAVPRVGSRSAPIKTSTYHASTSNGPGESKLTGAKGDLKLNSKFFSGNAKFMEPTLVTHSKNIIREFALGIFHGKMFTESQFFFEDIGLRKPIIGYNVAFE